VVKAVFDALMHQRLESAQLIEAALVLLVLVILLPVLQRAQARLAEQMGQSYVETVRAQLFAHLLRVSPRALQRRHRGGLTLRFIGDMGALRRWISLGLARLVVTGTTAVGVLIVIGLGSPGLAIALALSVLVGMVVAWRIGLGLQPRTQEARRRNSRLAAFVSERVAALATLHVCGQQGRERQRMARQLAQVRAASVERSSWAGLTRGVAESGALLAYGAVLLVGALEVMAGGASLGMVIASMAAVGVLMPQLRGLGRVLDYWHGYRVSARKIDDLLSLGRRLRQGGEAAVGAGELVLDNLCLSRGAIPSSARVAPGARVAIVGENGSGKSSLLAALVRLVEPETGRILLDGVAIDQMRLRDLRRQLALVSLDVPLLRGTVEYNLTYACRRPDPEWRAQVERWCGVDSLLAQWPEGLNHRITEGGGNLSAGQRVRILLARALFGAPKVVLLDEIDHLLDEEGQRLLDDMLEVYPGTVMWVSHDAQRRGRADQVWRLVDGRVIAEMPQCAPVLTLPRTRRVH